jgi:hypothetical protein
VTELPSPAPFSFFFVLQSSSLRYWLCLHSCKVWSQNDSTRSTNQHSVIKLSICTVRQVNVFLHIFLWKLLKVALVHRVVCLTLKSLVFVWHKTIFSFSITPLNCYREIASLWWSTLNDILWLKCNSRAECRGTDSELDIGIPD